MSDDLTERLPTEPSTRDLVLQLLERMGRVEAALGIGVETQPLSGRVNQIIASLAEFKHETREAIDDMELAVSSVQRDAARRYARLDDRLRAIEHPEEAKG